MDFGFIRLGLKPTIYFTTYEHTNYYTTEADLLFLIYFPLIYIS